MLSIRTIGRTAPRVATRFVSSAIRRPARPISLLQTSWKPARQQFAAPFSTSLFRREKAGEVDEELIAKLDSELEMEKATSEAELVATTVKDYLENGPFEIVDTAGQEEVLLKRTYGDEKIRVMFSIADLNNMEPENDYEDPALGDEEDMEGESSKEYKAASEDSMTEGEEDEGGEDRGDSFPARVNVIIEKASKGALAVEAVATDGQIVIENVYFYEDASLAVAKTAEKAHLRMDKYVGPPFGNLDEDLQVMLERYLDERGINTALALFVPAYIDQKEQKEYLRWLSNVKSFVEA